MEDLRDRIIQAYAEFKIEIGISMMREEPQIVLYKVIPGTRYYKDGSSNTGVTIRDITRYVEDVGAAIGYRCTISVKDDGIWLEVPRKDRGVVKDLGPRREGMYVPLGVSNGQVVPLDLSDPNTPHLLVAGTTGSGKSVFMNWLISFIIDNYECDEAALVLVDPKLVEFQAYEKAKNLLWPIANDTAEAVRVIRDLRWVAKERYAKLRAMGARNISETEWGHIILVIDEFAELIMNVPEIQEDIIGIAQIGRACGVHIVMATQSPHREIVTGLIKSNLPAKLVFRVTTTAASMVAMDAPDATRLRGKGDAIFTGHGEQDIRLQCPFITANEIEGIVARNLMENDPRQPERMTFPKARGVSSAAKFEMPAGELPLKEIFYNIGMFLVGVVKIVLTILYYIVYYTVMGIWWFLCAFCEGLFGTSPKKKRRKSKKQQQFWLVR
jgi:S-DNA-T family DNA segregation ATPase FtsK/SpoIIIE